MIILTKNKINKLFSKLGKKKLFWSFFVFLCFWIAIPTGQSETSDVAPVTSSQDYFISVQDAFQPIVSNLIIQQENVIGAISSPLFITPETTASLSTEQFNEEKYIIKHKVTEGETLSAISEKYNISVATILLANNLNNSKIYPGQELLILPVNGILHMVDKGETVDTLAKNYSAKKDEIISYNNLSADGNIYIGDIIIIPNGTMPKQVVPTIATSQNSTNVSNSYFIAPTKGIITQRSHYAYTSGGVAYYTAVDIANSLGTPVVAAASGTVQIVKNVWPYGNYVTIFHPNGVVTLYAHLSAFAKGITPGANVLQGAIIGYMGNTGKTINMGGNGSHLHFETRGSANPLREYALGASVSY
jgi:LysM repeat protein